MAPTSNGLSSSIPFEEGISQLQMLLVDLTSPERKQKISIETFFESIKKGYHPWRLAKFVRDESIYTQSFSKAFQEKNIPALQFLVSLQFFKDEVKLHAFEQVEILFFLFLDHQKEDLNVLTLLKKKDEKKFQEKFIEKYFEALWGFFKIFPADSYYPFFQELLNEILKEPDYFPKIKKLFCLVLMQNKSLSCRNFFLEMILCQALIKHLSFWQRFQLFYFLCQSEQENFFLQNNLFNRIELFFLSSIFLLIGLLGTILEAVLWPFEKFFSYSKRAMTSLRIVFLFINKKIFEYLKNFQLGLKKYF